MEWDEYRKRFEVEATKQGRGVEFIARSLSYAEPLYRQQLPIIFDSTHLSSLLGFESTALKAALQCSNKLYKTYFIPKPNGAFRRIDEPLPSLRQIQLWVLRNILDRCLPSDIATAFVKHRSIKHNAAYHVGSPMVLSLDVKDFFPAISSAQVESVFSCFGYSRSVVETLVQITVLETGLPQGAPTSPALSNLILRDFDEDLKKLAIHLNVRCSRYADDITISGEFDVGYVIRGIRRLLHRYGFRLSDEKTRLMLPHERQEITGVVVNKTLQAPRSVRRMLRQEIHYIKRFGIEAHEARSKSAYSNRSAHLRGVAEFILFLNPNDRDAQSAIQILGRVHYRRS